MDDHQDEFEQAWADLGEAAMVRARMEHAVEEYAKALMTIADLKAENKRLRDELDKLTPLDDEIEGFYCLTDGHNHRNRYAEALCSARFQLATCQGILDDRRHDERR